jgi:hypothetical protein
MRFAERVSVAFVSAFEIFCGIVDPLEAIDLVVFLVVCFPVAIYKLGWDLLHR